jgi:hypothetical protein
MRKLDILIIIILALLLSATNSFAHGIEVIFTTIATELLITSLILIFITRMKGSFTRKFIFYCMTLLSVGVSWVIIKDLPYDQNKILINAILWISPVISLCLVIVISKLLDSKSRQT